MAGAKPGFFKGGVTLCQSEGTHQIVTMTKILSWHFRHLLQVVWLKKACKRGGHGHPGTPPGFTLVWLYVAGVKQLGGCQCEDVNMRILFCL